MPPCPAGRKTNRAAQPPSRCGAAGQDNAGRQSRATGRQNRIAPFPKTARGGRNERSPRADAGRARAEFRGARGADIPFLHPLRRFRIFQQNTIYCIYRKKINTISCRNLLTYTGRSAIMKLDPLKKRQPRQRLPHYDSFKQRGKEREELCIRSSSVTERLRNSI